MNRPAVVACWWKLDALLGCKVTHREPCAFLAMQVIEKQVVADIRYVVILTEWRRQQIQAWTSVVTIVR